MKIVFMGTPDFAVSILDAVADAGHEIAAVVTQPDRPKGRGHMVAMSAVKSRALELNLPILQPVRVRKDPEFLQTLRRIAPDAVVVAAFGQILPQEVLDVPRLGCVNVHASLLPKYRGAAPIQWAVINGDRETGVTTMLMDAGLDTGDILEQKIVPLDPKETGGSLFDRLAGAGAELIVSTLDKLEKGLVTPVPQDESQATHVGMLKKDMGDIDWTADAHRIECLIRGLNPWPTAYSALDGKVIKIWDADVVSSAGSPDAAPGEILRADREGILVRTGENDLRIRELQPVGKRRMTADEFLRGHRIREGEQFTRVKG
jgi:methionyl-tRNA formyltransferase